MGMIGYLKDLWALMQRDRARAELATTVALRWRDTGCFLWRNDAELMQLALLWAHAFSVAFTLDRVEAGRRARSMAVADSAIQVIVSGGESHLQLDATPLWALAPVE